MKHDITRDRIPFSLFSSLKSGQHHLQWEEDCLDTPGGIRRHLRVRPHRRRPGNRSRGVRPRPCI
jgi:hypothetical protein